MNEHEYRAHVATMIRDSVVVTVTAFSVVALYHMSRSWHALWALSLLFLFGALKNVRRTAKPAAANTAANN